MALKFAVNNSLSAITSLPTAISTGSMTLLQTQTASNSSSIEFTSGIDSTYDIYKIQIINLHQTTTEMVMYYNFSSDGGSNYNVTKTSTMFRATHREDDGVNVLQYETAGDLAQSTADQRFTAYAHLDTNSDDCLCSSIFLYKPSSTTFVKHYMTTTTFNGAAGNFSNLFSGGYCNTTSAINAVKILPNSGTIVSGTFKLYGLS